MSYQCKDWIKCDKIPYVKGSKTIKRVSKLGNTSMVGTDQTTKRVGKVSNLSSFAVAHTTVLS